MTSGSGPSSRIEPASTTRRSPVLTHSYMMPDCQDARSTAARMPPGPADGVDRPEVVLVAVLDRARPAVDETPRLVP